MTFLPIVDRELRVASRRRGTYWLRFWLVLGTVVIWFLLLGFGNASTAEKGKVLFVAIGIIALGFCLLAGVFLTSDCLSEEKREGTLGLLFLTELKGYDVVLGKLIATSLHSFYGLLSILPILALPLLIGGVTVGEFWRVTLALIITLVFSLSAGMVVSGFCRETRQAMALTLLVVLVLSGILPVLYWLQVWLFRGAPSNWLLMWPSPPYLFSRSFAAFYGWRSGAREFWGSLTTIGGTSLGAFVIASLWLPRFWQEKALGKRQSEKQKAGWRQRLRFGTTEARLDRRMGLNTNPFFWLASRDRAAGWMGIMTLGSAFPVWICFVVGCYSRNMRTAVMSFYVVMFMSYGFHFVVKWLIAMEASRRLSEDNRSGALELLLVTPLTRRQILTGQRQALWELMRGPVLMALAANAVLFWIIVTPNLLKMPGEVAAIFCEIMLGGMAMMAVDFYAFSWVAMWMAMNSAKHHRAILGTLARLLLAPWLGVLLFVFLCIGGRGPSQGEVGVMIFFWFVLGGGMAIAFAARAKMGLEEAIRR